MDEIKREVYKGHVISLHYDEDSQDPREWSNVGKLCLSHKRYSLPNELDIDFSEFNSWQEVQEHIKKEFDTVLILPVQMYNHSSVSVYIGNTHDRWDGGQVGFIVAPRKDVQEAYNVKRITKNTLREVEKVLRGEVETYNQYLKGEVYGFMVDNGEGDSCFGYYTQEEAIQEAKGSIDYQVEKEAKEKQARVKQMIKAHVPLQYRMAL